MAKFVVIWVDDEIKPGHKKHEQVQKIVHAMKGELVFIDTLIEYQKLLCGDFLKSYEGQHIIILHDFHLFEFQADLTADGGVKELKNRSLPVIMLTYADQKHLNFSYDAYVSKENVLTDLFDAIEGVLQNAFPQIVSLGTVGGEEIGYLQLMDKRIAVPVFLKPLSERKRQLQGCVISQGCNSDLITYRGEQYIPVGSKFLENDREKVDETFHDYNLTPGFLDKIWHDAYEKEVFELLGSVGKKEGIEVMVSLYRRHVTNEFITDDPKEIGKIFWFNFEDLAISWGSGLLKDHPHFKDFDIGTYVKKVVEMSMFGDGISQYAYPKGKQKIKVS